jgi:hypothetical protein
MKYLFLCPECGCHEVGEGMHDDEEGSLTWCPQCEAALVVGRPLRRATAEEIAAHDKRKAEMFKKLETLLPPPDEEPIN